MRARQPVLIDTGAAVSLASTTLWDKLHRQSPGLSLLSTSFPPVLGDRDHVPGHLVLELELAGQFCVHQHCSSSPTSQKR